MVRHRVILRGYGAASAVLDAPPLIAKRTEPEFIPALLDELGNGTPPTALDKRGATDVSVLAGRETRRLFQPIHRTFNLVVLEAACEAAGHPRIHPSDIASAGFVVRRIANLDRPGDDQGWLHRKDQPLGWARLADPQLDPDAAQRRPLFRAGHPGINAELSRLYAPLEPAAERISPLFLAPPEVCTAAKRTVLYGVVPVTSAEERELDPQSCVDLADVRALLLECLQVGTGDYRLKPIPAPLTSFPHVFGFIPPPVIPVQLTPAEVAAVLASETDPKDEQLRIWRFVHGLRALHTLWKIQTPDAENSALLAELNKLEVQFLTGYLLVDAHGRHHQPGNIFGLPGSLPNLHWEPVYTRQPLGEFLNQAIANLVAPKNPTTPLRLPEIWPLPTADAATAIASAARAFLVAQYGKNPPRHRRFDDEHASYRLHAFVRVKHSEECPPVLHWSAPSEPFTIVPWWESGATVHTIALPDFDFADWSKVKPNVAFTLPPKLANLLNQGSAEKLVTGSGRVTANPAITWICSFSIPVITLCAFIVLNIFLQLFNLIFGWMFSIKICLPFKKP